MISDHAIVWGILKNKDWEKQIPYMYTVEVKGKRQVEDPPHAIFVNTGV